MKPNDLERFFGELLKREKYIPSESMAVLGKLIRLTLAYRDRRKAETGEILTVEETKKALDAYQTALKDGKIQEGLDTKTAGLVELWLKEINGKHR